MLCILKCTTGFFIGLLLLITVYIYFRLYLEKTATNILYCFSYLVNALLMLMLLQAPTVNCECFLTIVYIYLSTAPLLSSFLTIVALMDIKVSYFW